MIRKQLTIFIEDETIEQIRAKFNPIQYALIPAHITLCREDEIIELEKIIKNIKAMCIKKPIQITLNKIEMFENAKGLLISSSEENNDFHNLRLRIINSHKKLLPHITLMHPRNSTYTNEILEEIKLCKIPELFFVERISLIEQKNGSKWKVLDEFIL